MGGGVAHGEAGVSQIDVVGEDFRSIIARLFPAEHQAHRWGVGVATEGFLLQDTQSGDRVGGGGWGLAVDQLTIGPCACGVEGLENRTVWPSHTTPSCMLGPPY